MLSDPPMKRRLDDRRLQRRQLRGDRNARAEMVERYLPLARGLAFRYRHGGEPVDDLIQVASVGLLKALQRWDPERGTAFSSFAVPTIVGELRRYLRDFTWAVKPPRATQELALLAAKARERVWNEHARPATVAEIAEALGRSHEDVSDALEAAGARRSEPLDELGGPDVDFGRVLDAVTIGALTAVLDERAREVVRLRFSEDLVQRDIAERVGCSQMQVSRILRDALKTMQRHAGLHDQLGLAAA
jgi:RNA polymerase sigma-B factor